MLNLRKDNFKQLTKCICPNCNKEHKFKIHWIGRGVPKIYCKNCKGQVNSEIIIYGNGSRGSYKKSHQPRE